MATPRYQGGGQPPNGNGSWFGSWLGETPAYQGAGQPGAKSSAFGGSSPAYKSAPANASPDECAPAQIAIVIPREVVDPQQ